MTRRTTIPAPVLFGAIAGTFSGLSALLVTAPISMTLRAVEIRETAEDLQRMALAFADQGNAQEGWLLTRGAEGVEGPQGTVGPTLPRVPCATRPVRVPPWTVHCAADPHGAIVRFGKRDGWWLQMALGLQLFTAAAVAGTTASSISLALRPLSKVVAGLRRVEAGERDVRLPSSALSELDELVRHVNDTARAVDEREGAVLRQLDTVNQLSRMVAHEVRNPLQTLELLTSLVAEEADPAERATLAQAIHAEIRALDTVVQRVLRDGVGTAILTVQPVLRSIAPLLEQVTLLHRAQAHDRGVTLLRTQVDDRLIPFDPALLGRSIENLVVNALHAVPQPGGRIELSAWVEDGFLQIATDDNGPGIDPALGDAVFQADVSTRAGGTGLGLALVWSVVHAHGGYVHQERSPLGGARLLIQLPLEGPPVASVSPEHPRR